MTTYEIRGDETSPLTSQYVRTLIYEPGLYSLVFGSKLESAKKFKRWVFTDVLPSIRKQGFYTLPGALEAMKAIKIPDIWALDEDDRIEFRRESKSRSNAAKDPEKVKMGRKGGRSMQAEMRRVKEENERLLNNESRLSDKILELETELVDIKDLVNSF